MLDPLKLKTSSKYELDSQQHYFPRAFGGYLDYVVSNKYLYTCFRSEYVR